MASSEGYFTTLTQPKKATSSEVAHPNEIDTAPIWTYLQYSVDLAALTRLCAMALNFFFFFKKNKLAVWTSSLYDDKPGDIVSETAV